MIAIILITGMANLSMALQNFSTPYSTLLICQSILQFSIVHKMRHRFFKFQKCISNSQRMTYELQYTSVVYGVNISEWGYKLNETGA